MKKMTKKKAKKTILITAGPTREAIDPVRFISNYSTGKMGSEIAIKAIEKGYEVIYITGPTAIQDPKGAQIIHIETAVDMYNAVHKYYNKAHGVIMTSAVCDYRPQVYSTEKIKSNIQHRDIHFVRNPDILKSLGANKGKKILVGFAVETLHLTTSAFNKLKEKNLDCIVANSIAEECNPFGTGKTNLTLLFSDGAKREYHQISKKRFAGILLDKIATLMQNVK